ncbi:MAG TPA: ABC transporter permease subunit, partial [Acidimicrobiales bacterium]|nr:ABC transporter permease subunit [Acidimicrobiales bacterium]
MTGLVSRVPERAPAPREWVLERTSRRRRLRDRGFLLFAGLALLLLVAPLAWVLIGVVEQAVRVWSWHMLTATTASGGLANAIVGTLVLMLGVLVVAGAVGLGCGIYIAESSRTRMRSVLRGASEVLSGVPSIVIGYVAYVALVVGLRWGYSLVAAVVALSVLVVPYVAKSSELAISRVPTAYREGAEALGMTRAQVLRRVVLRSAVPGISTGLIVALAISVGETAPLLYTMSFTNGYPTTSLTHSSLGYLTYVAYIFWDEPSAADQNLAHAAALVLIVIVLGLI